MFPEIDQLQTLLQPGDFWEDDYARGNSIGMGGGVSVKIEGKEAPYHWQATWSDGSTATAEQTFKTVKEAKADLKKALRSRIEELDDEGGEPATTSMGL